MNFDDEYSERSYMSHNSHTSHNNDMLQNQQDFEENNGSYRRGRSPITGRYVSRDNGGSSRRYYDGNSSRNSNYSGHSILDRMVAKLEQMYDEANSDHERKIVQDWINRISYGD